MAFLPFPELGAHHRPHDHAAASIKPHQFSRVWHLMTTEWRCPRCGAAPVHGFVESDLTVRCVNGHRSTMKTALEHAQARVDAAARRRS
jgi:hypothetical protein